MIERLLLTLLYNGNLLLEGLSGLAKMHTINSLAAHLDAEFRRLQFTPNLFPSDVTDTQVYYKANGRGTCQFLYHILLEGLRNVVKHVYANDGLCLTQERE